jgi:hypothetical protein
VILPRRAFAYAQDVQMSFTLNNRFQVKLKSMIEVEIESLREKALVQVNLTESELRRMQGEYKAYLNMLELMSDAERDVLAEQ